MHLIAGMLAVKWKEGRKLRGVIPRVKIPERKIAEHKKIELSSILYSVEMKLSDLRLRYGSRGDVGDIGEGIS